MCNATPKAGETWIFRRPARYAGHDPHDIITGVLVETHRGLKFGPGGSWRIKEVGEESNDERFCANLRFAEGWEPFLRLEGETQEHPTAPTWNVKHNLDPVTVVSATWDENGITQMRLRWARAQKPQPKVGETWLFDSKKRGIEASVWFGAVLAVGEGWWVLRDASRKPSLLTSAEWTPTHKLVG